MLCFFSCLLGCWFGMIWIDLGMAAMARRPMVLWYHVETWDTLWYPLVNCHITMENHHFYGKIHYKWPFSIVILPLPEGTCFHFPGILMFRVITRILIQSSWDSPSIPSPQRQGSDVPPRFWEPGASPVQGRIFSDSRVAVSWLKGSHWKWHGFFGSSKYIEHDRTEQYIFVYGTIICPTLSVATKTILYPGWSFWDLSR